MKNDKPKNKYIELLDKQAKELEELHKKELRTVKDECLIKGVFIGLFLSAVAYYLGGALSVILKG